MLPKPNSRLLAYLIAVLVVPVAIARNGLEAIQLIKHSQPDLVLIDIPIPEIDGLEVIQRIF
jgi:CheY-like chemotaxis protein